MTHISSETYGHALNLVSETVDTNGYVDTEEHMIFVMFYTQAECSAYKKSTAHALLRSLSYSCCEDGKLFVYYYFDMDED